MFRESPGAAGGAGNAFALAALAQRYWLRIAPGQRDAPAVLIAMRPREGIWMFLEKAIAMRLPRAGCE